MSNEELHIDGDFTLNIPHFEADFTENEQPKMQADFKIQTGGSTSFANITGDPYDNSALAEALNQKADNSIVETLSETVENNYTELDGKITDESDARTQADADLQSNIDDVADDLSIETDNRQTADADLQDNIDTVDGKIDTHIADKSNPHEVTKTQIGLGNVDNTSDLNKPISTATQTALNGKQNTINDLSEIRTNASNGQSAYNTIQTYGDIVTYDASNFATSIQGQKADTALQPNDNISELNNDAGYITSASLPTVNNSTITFQKNNVTVGDFNLNQPNNETINISVPTQASDVNALPDTTTIEDLTTTAQQNAINSGANTTNIGQIATNTSNISSLSNTVTNNYNTLDGRMTSEVSTLNTTIGTETTNRQNADNNLQSQIDAIVSSSDVFDIVGTYAELQAYDISTVPVNDIIKVLVDSTHSNAATYYRCVETGGVKSWSYIGSEGAYYTKSESDSLFVEQTTTVNGKALSTNITLTASDVGALPSSTTIGNGTLTIQNNSVDVDTFSANATSNKTINIITPTKTSDLTNDSGFIDSSGLSSYATTTDLTNGLATKQDTIGDLSTIRSNAANGQSAYTTIGGYGDIVTYNASNFVQKNGDSSTQTISLTSGTGTTALGIKSMATSSYLSLSGSSGWLGSYGVSSSKRAVFYNGTGYTLAYTSEIPTNTSDLTNDSGYITGITSSDVTTALGYTPYNSSNPAGYTSNVGTVTSVNGNQPDANGDVTLTIPTVNDGILTITQNGTSKGTFSANQSTNDTIALTDTTYNAFTGADGTNAGSSGLVPAPSATDNDKYLKGDGTWTSVSSGSSTDVQINGTSITNQGVANIITNSAYDASSNKIATMSDLPADEIFVAEYNVTTYQQVLDAYNAGKTIFCTIPFSGLNIDCISGLSDIKQDLSEFYFNYTTGKPITFNGTNKPAYFNNCAIKLTSSSVWSYEYTAIPTINYAVTHTPSTAVGSSTKPIYISSTGAATASTSTVGSSTTPVYLNAGTITSTGLSIASSRFDGQWVYSFSEIDTSTSIGDHVISLSSYLPNDSYKYEVLINVGVYCSDSNNAIVYMSSDILAIPYSDSYAKKIAHCNTNSRAACNRFTMPVGTGRTLTKTIKNKAPIYCSVGLLGYRRIGTNT